MNTVIRTFWVIIKWSAFMLAFGSLSSLPEIVNQYRPAERQMTTSGIVILAGVVLFGTISMAMEIFKNYEESEDLN